MSDGDPGRAPPVLYRRRAGVLVHVTSLPGPGPYGALGAHARRFIDLLAECGLGVWQVLPLGPTHAGGSPYESLSAHAGDPRLLDPADLAARGLLPPGGGDAEGMAAAHDRFEARARADDRAAFETFERDTRAWLDDYADFYTIKETTGGAPWWEWPQPLRDRQSGALAEARRVHARIRARCRFEQFLFRRQWTAIKRYANARGILLFGDMPMFVARDSAEVWSRRDLFELEVDGTPRFVAGVPPDLFSDEGQRWGNPLYDWGRMGADGYQWWIERMRSHLALYDLVRIDHFRGFEAYWRIPACSQTAMVGEWCPGPGAALFDAIRDALGTLPVVAEDLGFITGPVHALRQRLGFPGMRVLQFAFDGGRDNPHLPENHVENSVVYTGTHDNDTALGWFRSLDEPTRARVCEYLGTDGADMPWPVVRAALSSRARLAMIPLQDLLALGSEHRMNTPGTSAGNWTWRFDWRMVPAELTGRMRAMLAEHDRLAR